MGRTTDEWFDNLAPELRKGLSLRHETTDEAIIEGRLKELKDNFPKAEPYVLTHGDLHFENIIVKDGKIEAIIDWEFAGFYPWWVERVQWNRTSIEDGFFDRLAEDIYPEMNEETFRREIYAKVEAVREVWEWCPREHPNRKTQWLLPGFCKCKPYFAWMNWDHIGNHLEHKISDLEMADINPENCSEELRIRYWNTSKYSYIKIDFTKTNS